MFKKPNKMFKKLIFKNNWQRKKKSVNTLNLQWSQFLSKKL